MPDVLSPLETLTVTRSVHGRMRGTDSETNCIINKVLVFRKGWCGGERKGQKGGSLGSHPRTNGRDIVSAAHV